ncbi:flagellar basal-body MS-ring/collar protein FliF [Microbulbifer sp. ANSA005]|uniref:flagellar basal-body MS-ring/collar protein FliF n=1 Tax=Microbulbifer sp. ANSA005 TaxID=3243362 RepID=UPI0040431732
MPFDFKSNQMRIILFFIVVSVLIALILIFLFNKGKPALAYDLTNDELVRVADELARENIAFDIERGTGSIYVDQNDLSKSRMIVAGSGALGQQNIGFEIFDSSTYGLTNFSQRVFYQRALQGELEKSIKTLAIVRSARVHLVIPEYKAFRKNSEDAKASVILDLKDGNTLEAKEIIGIQFLLSSAVPNLNSENVTIMDVMGRLLSGQDDGMFGGSQYMDLKLEVERHYHEKISRLFSGIMKPNKFEIVVDVTLDNTKRESTKNGVVPLSDSEAGLLINSKSDRKFREKKATPSTIGSLDGQDDSILSESIENSYQYTTELVKTKEVPGAIQKISISVILSKDIEDSIVGKLENLIINSAGLDLKRGDRVSVEKIIPVEIVAPLHTEITQVNNVHLRNQVKLKQPDVTDKAYFKLSQEEILRLLQQYWLYILLIVIVFSVWFLNYRKNRISKPEREALLEDIRLFLVGDIKEGRKNVM